MGLSKYSYQGDAVANLYRAAFYLAKGSKNTSLGFLKKAVTEIKEKLDPAIIKMADFPRDYLKTSRDQHYWAEKILDQYTKFKNLL